MPLLFYFVTFLATLATALHDPPTPVTSEPPPPTPQAKVKISRGVYAAEIEGTTLYEMLSAVTFEFRLPDWLPNRVLMYDQDCDSDVLSLEDPASTYTCPIYHYLHKIRDDLRPIMQLSDLTFPPSPSKSAFHLGECDSITSHFPSLTMTKEVLDSYMKHLGKCLEGRVVHSLGIEKYNQSSVRLPYAMMMSNFVLNYFQNLPSDGHIDLAVLLNAVTGYNALGFTQALAEGQRWRNAIFDCKMNNIPTSLVTLSMMEKSLQKLNEVLRGHQLELALPLNSNTISEYYRQKLTDCVFTNRSLFVRVLVPTKREGRPWKLVSVRSVPFRLSENETELICSVKEFDQVTTFVFDPVSKDVFHHKCNAEERFCRVQLDTASVEDFKKTCASVVLSGESHKSRLSKFCELKCQASDDFYTPIFTRVASDKFIIAGNPAETVVAQVDSQVNIIHPVEKGALEIVLPCRGVILYENRKFTVREPCGKSYRVVQVHPVHW